MLLELVARLDAPIEVVSRSDSTLRGHVTAEVRALDAVRREVTGRGYDGVLVVPAYFEAGRFTAGNVHWARVGADLDVVVLGLLDAAAAGKSFLYRTGPSFVQALAGLDPQDPGSALAGRSGGAGRSRRRRQAAGASAAASAV